MSRYAIGIDYGTESGRVMLTSIKTGEEAAWALIPYPNGVLETALPTGEKLGHDWALQDPRDYLHVVEQGVPQVLKQSGIKPEQVVGIGTDFTACTMLPTLADGTPLCTLPEFETRPHAWVKLWKHHAAQPQADKINRIGKKRKEKALEMYNWAHSSEWFFAKALQIVEEDFAVYEKAGKLIEAADWIVWQLTGNERRNECTAGYKDMWLKGDGFPSKDFFAALDPRMANIVEEKLATTFYPLGSRAGGLTAAMAAKTGLLEGTPVAVGHIDAHAGVPACGVTGPGVLVMIMGTSLCHMLMANERRIVEGVAGVVEGGIVPGYYGYEAGQAAVGDLYGWFFKAFGVKPDEITAKAAALRPGQSGLVALDWWNGNRSVLMNADLSGVLVGATLSTGPHEIYRALIEATAFGTLTVIRAFEREGIQINRLMACGGLPEKSPLVMQIFADVTNRTIELPRSLQGSGLGAAMHGAVSGGAFANIAEAAGQMGGASSQAYVPNPEANRIYTQLYEQYLALHDWFGRGGTDIMKRLKAIRAGA